jgi:hypothetical protein
MLVDFVGASLGLMLHRPERFRALLRTLVRRGRAFCKTRQT